MRASLFAGLLAALFAATAHAQQVRVETGKDIAFNRARGDCLACHGFPALAEAEAAGNAGPPMIAMQARFPDRAMLREKIWDATRSNPGSAMPPFGRHGILTAEEIDQVVEFLYGL